MPESKARVRRLSIWFTLNLIIFIICYLNYRFQLKHRYLFRTLSVGLCFSRAAAMVINFNLLLVWLPMCKYSLTKLACIGSGSMKILKVKLQELQSSADSIENNQFVISTHRAKFTRLRTKFNLSIIKLNLWFIETEINTIKSFLVAVDHCKSLHTICATTITIASVIHTVAHLINVINFSNNFNPLLNNLNMAEYKGQNPLQLLISVPGITGCLMIVILILMSLSSVDFIRNSSFDLFQIFHRLSIVFVILLFIHPSSHVLKEQSNVIRHNPDICPLLNETSISTSPSTLIGANNFSHAFNADSAINKDSLMQKFAAESSSDNPTKSTTITTKSSLVILQSQFSINKQDNNDIKSYQEHSQIDLTRRSQKNSTTTKPTLAKVMRNKRDAYNDIGNQKHEDCLDPKPLFVDQSSICWYVLCMGLSCYLIDLSLRKCRRSKSSVELLNVRVNQEGNLIELILNSNHKRFAHWQPGQFVYVNCPQIANCEWHPFTISSMNDQSRHFTLHIKTGGDWTRKLRDKLEVILSSENSMSQTSMTNNSTSNFNFLKATQANASPMFDSNNTNSSNLANNLQLSTNNNNMQNLPSFECYDQKTGELVVECTRLVKIKTEYENKGFESEDAIEISFDEQRLESNTCVVKQNSNNSFYSICDRVDNEKSFRNQATTFKSLDLYIDGPFHSPFERLLEQEISVCIANGVGWTAFSSVFQCVLNRTTTHDKDLLDNRQNWWSKWKDFAVIPSSGANSSVDLNRSCTCDNVRKSIHHPTTTTVAPRASGKLSQTNIHLMVIVTSLEQLEPFYYFSMNYFNKVGNQQANGHDHCPCKSCICKGKSRHLNPVREITAFITRFSETDDSVRNFCSRENLTLFNDQRVIKVNDVFTIQFGKPNFDFYLKSFSSRYFDMSKISVYCCGSFQVKNSVQEICKNLNRTAKKTFTKQTKHPIYCYHEENF